MPHLSDVFYDTDFSPYVAFDWVYNGLEPAARQEIQEGISAFMHFKMRCMDRWTQTPTWCSNPPPSWRSPGWPLRSEEVIDWGFYRKPESRIGGLFPGPEQRAQGRRPLARSADLSHCPYRPLLHGHGLPLPHAV